MSKLLWSFIISLCSIMLGLDAKVTLQSKSSSLSVASGATLTAENPITGLAGSVQKQEGATIAGQSLSFDQGTYQDGSNKVKLSGSLNISDVVEYVLSGNETFKASSVGQVMQKIKIKGKSNRIEGAPTVVGGLEFEDNAAEATYALNGRIDCDIVLNGGKMMLEQDLVFADNHLVTGSGTIVFNGRKIQLGNTPITWSDPIVFDSGSDIDLNANVFLSDTWTFTGLNILNGNNHILFLQQGGQIVVDSNSTLLIKNLVINNLAGSNMRCTDFTSSITCQDVEMNVDGYFNFSQGALHCLHGTHCSGEGIFAYTSDQVSSVEADSRFKLDLGMTFSYDPSIVSENLLTFVDETSQLLLNGATLYTTHTGLMLSKGRLLMKKNCTFSSENTNGVILGDGNNDMKVQLFAGVTLDIVQGGITFNNLVSDSHMFGKNSAIQLAANTTLNLYQNLYLDNSFLLLGDGVTVNYIFGVDIIGGGMGQLGTLIYNEI